MLEIESQVNFDAQKDTDFWPSSTRRYEKQDTNVAK